MPTVPGAAVETGVPALLPGWSAAAAGGGGGGGGSIRLLRTAGEQPHPQQSPSADRAPRLHGVLAQDERILDRVEHVDVVAYVPAGSSVAGHEQIPRVVDVERHEEGPD